MPHALLAPVFVQVLLTLVLMGLMGRRRLVAVRSGAVKMRDVALSGAGFPEQARAAANSYINQFELPVLFYTVVAFALITGQAGAPGGLLVLLAWSFVLSRIVHAVIHVSTNFVPYRFYAFLVGGVLLSVMWIVLAARLWLGTGV
jgi:hypothetical protein